MFTQKKLTMDHIPENKEFDESRPHLFQDFSGTQERLMREMNEYLASISQSPIEADGSGETSKTASCLSSDGSLSERPRKPSACAAATLAGTNGGAVEEDDSDGEKAHRGSMSSIDEGGGQDYVAREYAYYNDFDDDDSVIAMAKRMDDAFNLSDPSLICGPSEKYLALPPIPPVLKKLSAGKSACIERLKLGRTNGSNRSKAVPPPPPRNASNSQRPPRCATPRQQPKQVNSHSPASAPRTSPEFESKTNRGPFITSSNPSCSPTRSKECIGAKRDGHRRVSSDSANSHSSEQSCGELAAAIGSHVSTPKGKRSLKLAPTTCEEGTKARGSTGSNVGEPTQGGDVPVPMNRKSTSTSGAGENSAGHKVMAKSGLKDVSRQEKRLLRKLDSKPDSEGDDDLMRGVGLNTRIHASNMFDDEPKTVQIQPQSQCARSPQIPPQRIDGLRRADNDDDGRVYNDDSENDSDEPAHDEDLKVHAKAHAHRPMANSHGPRRKKHSQRQQDQYGSSDYDDDGAFDSSTQTLKARGDAASEFGEPIWGDDDAISMNRNSASVSASAAGEQLAGHKVMAKSGLKSSSRQGKRRLRKLDSKPDSDGDDDLMRGVGWNTRVVQDGNMKYDNEPKKVRIQPQSQYTKNSRMPHRKIDGQMLTDKSYDGRESDDDGDNDSNEWTDHYDVRVYAKANALKSLGNSQRPPRGKHSQRQHDQYDSSDYDEDSDTQTQFFYESTDDEEELEAVGKSVADAVKNLNEKRAVAKVKNLLGNLF